MAKKKWVIPKLIVVIRGKPEEMVLWTCKYPRNAGFVSGQDHCIYRSGYCINCEFGQGS